MIKVEIIPVLNDNYVYLIKNLNNSKIAIVDPGDAKPIISFLNKESLKLDEIILTHHHDDHIAGCNELINIWEARLTAPLFDKDKIPFANRYVSDNDIIDVIGLTSKIISSPGHTLGHICYYFQDDNILFSGDTLFRLGCGRVFEGTMDQMKDSLKKIRNLPDDTLVFCGHEYTLSNAKFCLSFYKEDEEFKKLFDEIEDLVNINKPTIPFLLGQEKRFNPFLQFDNKKFKEFLNIDNFNESEVFEHIRLKKDSF